MFIYFLIHIHIYIYVWAWLKIEQEGLRRFWPMFPLTRVPFWYRLSEPQPYICIYIYVHLFPCSQVRKYRMRLEKVAVAGVQPKGPISFNCHVPGHPSTSVFLKALEQDRAKHVQSTRPWSQFCSKQKGILRGLAQPWSRRTNTWLQERFAGLDWMQTRSSSSMSMCLGSLANFQRAASGPWKGPRGNPATIEGPQSSS